MINVGLVRLFPSKWPKVDRGAAKKQLKKLLLYDLPRYTEHLNIKQKSYIMYLVLLIWSELNSVWRLNLFFFKFRSTRLCIGPYTRIEAYSAKSNWRKGASPKTQTEFNQLGSRDPVRARDKDPVKHQISVTEPFAKIVGGC